MAQYSYCLYGSAKHPVKQQKKNQTKFNDSASCNRNFILHLGVQHCQTRSPRSGGTKLFKKI